MSYKSLNALWCSQQTNWFDCKTGTGNEPAAIVTCVPVIVQREGLVAVLAVAKRSHRAQSGVVFSLGGYHIDWGLCGTTTIWEIIWPLALTNQAFDRRKKVTVMSFNHTAHWLPAAQWTASIDGSLIMPNNYSSIFPFGFTASWQWSGQCV